MCVTKMECCLVLGRVHIYREQVGQKMSNNKALGRIIVYSASRRYSCGVWTKRRVSDASRV